MDFSKWALRVGLMLGTCLFVLASLEFFLKALHLPPYPNRCISKLYITDPETGFIFKPGTSDTVSAYEYKTPISINSIGLRDNEPVLDAPNSIFTVGDSFTEGRGVNMDASFPKQIEKNLHQPVVNLGISSIGTREGIILLKRYLKKFKNPPQWIILSFYVGNDFYDNNGSLNGPMNSASNGYLVGQGQSILEEGHLVHVLNEKNDKVYTYQQDKFQPPIRIGLPWLEQKKIYNILANTLYGYKPTRDFFIQKNMAEKPTYGLPVVIPGLFEKSFSWETSPDWKNTQKYLEDFVTICSDVGAKPLLVIIPAVCQLDPSLVKKFPPYRDPSTLEADPSISILTSFAESRSVANINLLTEFRKFAPSDQRKLYYKADTHWTSFGHEMVGKIISDHIKKTEL